MYCKPRGRIYGDQDAEYLKGVERERIELVAPTADYYSLNRGKNVDALYGEPDNDPLYGGSSARGTPQRHSESWNFYPDRTKNDPPLLIVGVLEYVQYDNRNPSVRDEGKHVEYDALFTISAVHWECGVEGTPVADRLPKEGDILYVFSMWWDVVKVGTSGNIRATSTTTGYKLDLRKRSQFEADRKLP